MLIKVFDKWINPTHITEITMIGVHTAVVHLLSGTKVEYYAKLSDEVAEEINKQLMK